MIYIWREFLFRLIDHRTVPDEYKDKDDVIIALPQSPYLIRAVNKYAFGMTTGGYLWKIKFEDMELQLDKLEESKLIYNDEKIKEINEGFEEIIEEFEKINEEIKEVNKKVEEINKKDSEIEKINREVSEINKKIEKIIITKPVQESGENLGALPGTIEEKIDPYKQSYYTTFCKIIGKAQTEFLFATEEIVFEPLAYMRGSTYDNCVMLLDECQNATIKQLMLWSTRLGQDSKAIMMGDVSQYDLKKRDSGYQTFIRMVGGENPMESLCLFEFKNEDIVRNKFLIELTRRYDKWRSETND